MPRTLDYFWKHFSDPDNLGQREERYGEDSQDVSHRDQLRGFCKSKLKEGLSHSSDIGDDKGAFEFYQRDDLLDLLFPEHGGIGRIWGRSTCLSNSEAILRTLPCLSGCPAVNCSAIGYRNLSFVSRCCFSFCCSHDFSPPLCWILSLLFSSYFYWTLEPYIQLHSTRGYSRAVVFRVYLRTPQRLS